MDPQEILALFGSAPEQPPADLESIANQVYGTPAPNQGYDQAALDFQPQTYYPEPAPRTVDAYGNPMAPQAPAPIQPPAAPPTSKSQSVSHQGYSPEKAAQIDAGPYGKTSFGKTRAGIEQGIRADYADELAGQQGADQAELQAADQVALAETEQISARARLEGDRAKFLREQEQGLRAIYESGNVAINQAKNEYLLRLASIPEVNPNALWDEAGTEGQFQMGVAAVIHNMLGVKGINTTAMDTINTAIKNKIAAQIENINTKKYVASGFKDLWDATVAESGSRMEAEAKMHGYMLKAFEAGIDAEMGKIDSNVARAKHAYTKAQLQQAQIKNRLEVENHIQQNTQKAVDTEAELYRARLQASTVRAQIASNERIANAQAKAKQKEAKPRIHMFDPETGKAVLVAREGAPEKLVEKTLESAQKIYAADKAMTKLMELERTIGTTVDGIVKTRFSNEDIRNYQAITKRLAHSMLAAMGERATEADVAQYLEGLPIKTALTNGGVSKILGTTHKQMHEALDGQVLQVFEDVDPADAPVAPKNRIMQGSATAAAMAASGEDKISDPSAAEGVVERIKSPAAMRPIDDTETDEYTQYTKPYWEDFRKNATTKTSDALPGIAQNVRAELPPKAFDEVRELAEMAFTGDNIAEAQLKSMAAGQFDPTSKASSLVKEASTYFLDKIEKARAADEIGNNPLTGLPNTAQQFGYAAE